MLWGTWCETTGSGQLSKHTLLVFGCGCQDEINLAWAVKVWICFR